MALKKYPNSKQFIRELEKGLKGNIYLFLGEEEGEKDKVINTMLDRVFQSNPERQNNTGRFHISDEKSSAEEFTAAADFALSPSMFSAERVCILRNVDRLKLTETSKNILGDMLTGLPGGTILIMTSPKNQMPSYMEKEFSDAISAIQFWKYFDSDIYSYVSRGLKESGIKCSGSAVQALLELTGNDIRKIDEAIDMLSYSAGGEQLDDNALKMIIGEVREVTIFDFIDSLFRKEKKCLNYLKTLLEEGTAELLILNMITRQADMLEKYFYLTEGTATPEEAMKKLGLSSSKKRREQFQAMLKKFTPSTLRRVYPLISKSEYRIKSGGQPDSVIAMPVFELSSAILKIR